MKIHLNFYSKFILRIVMVSGRSVTGLKSAISFLISQGTNDHTPRKGKNLKIGKQLLNYTRYSRIFIKYDLFCKKYQVLDTNLSRKKPQKVHFSKLPLVSLKTAGYGQPTYKQIY